MSLIAEWSWQKKGSVKNREETNCEKISGALMTCRKYQVICHPVIGDPEGKVKENETEMIFKETVV